MTQQSIKTMLTANVVSVSPGTPLSEAVLLMEKNKISCLVILEGKKPIGIFTERDLLFLASRGDRFNGIKIKDVMSKSVITANTDTDIYEAYGLLETNKIRHLIIVDHNGEISGVVTQTDIINNLGLEYFIELKNISKIMTGKVITLEKERVVRDAVSAMAAHSVSCIVVEENKYPVGILTERDIVRLFRMGADIGALIIEKAMSHPVQTISSAATVHEAAGVMHYKKIRRLVVTDKDGRISGLVTQYDIIKNLEKKYIEFLKKIIIEKENLLQETEKILSEKIVLDNILQYSTNMAIIATDIDFHIVYYNPAAERVFGYKAEEVIGKKVIEIHAKEEVDAFRFEKAVEIIRTEGSFKHTLKLKRGGGIRFVGSTISGIRDKNYTLVGFVLLAQDITKRREAEEEKRRDYDIQTVLNSLLSLSLESISLEETLRRALDLILSIPWLAFESKGSIFLANDNREFLVLKAQKELPEDSQKTCARIEFGECLCGSAALKKEIEFAERIDSRHEIRYKGMELHGHYCVPIMFANKLLGVMNIYVKEGHMRNQKEDAFLTSVANTLAGVIVRKQMEEDLKKASARFKTLIQAIPDVVFLKDLHGRHLVVNKACEELTGLTQTEIMGKTDEQFLPPDLVEKCKMSDEEAMRSPKPLHIEEQFTGKNGEQIFLDTIKVPLYDEQGSVIGIVGVCRDITKRKKMEEYLLRAKKLESIATLSGGIAHDFNNLLTSILGYISISKMSLNPEDNIFKNLSFAEDACLRAKELTHKLVAFAIGEYPAKKPSSIAKLLKNSAASSVIDPKYKCEFSMPEELWLVEIDENQITQVIHSLFENACDAMPGGGIIDICAENINVSPQDNLPINEGPYVKISIKDYGVGIPKENLAKIFDPYFTTKGMDFHKGVGLGLAVCFSIIKNHDGHISAESEQGKGTTFHIYLPACRKEILT